MVGFDHQSITTPKVVFYIGGQVAQISHYANLYSVGLEGKAAWISRVVRNGERRHGNVGNFKAAAYLKVLAPFQLCWFTFRIFGGAPPAMVCGLSNVNRDLQFARQHLKSRD